MIDNNKTRWVVGILVVIYLIGLLYTSYGLFDSINSINKLTEKYKVYDEQEESIEILLNDKHYEVLTVHISNYSASAPFFELYGIEDDTICEPEQKYCDSDKVSVAVEMKSLGSRNEQIWHVLISMSVVYKNAFTYRIDILSPTDKCEYIIFGDVYRAYTDSHTSESREKVQYQIDNLVSCS